MSKAWFALAVVALVLLAVLGRYQLVPATHDDAGIVFKLDRWTGEARLFFVSDRGAGWSVPLGNWTPPKEQARE